MGQKNKNISNVDFANGKATVSSDFYNDGIDHYVVPCSDDVLLKQLDSISSYSDWFEDFKKQKKLTHDFGYGGILTARSKKTARFQLINFLYGRIENLHIRERSSI